MKQQPFLFAAKCVAPEFLGMDFASGGGKVTSITRDGLLSQVTKKAEDRDAFRRLCSAAKAAAPVIDVEWSAEVANALELPSRPCCPRSSPFPPSFCPRRCRAGRQPKRGRQFVSGSEISDPGRRNSL